MNKRDVEGEIGRRKQKFIESERSVSFSPNLWDSHSNQKGCFSLQFIASESKWDPRVVPGSTKIFAKVLQ